MTPLVARRWSTDAEQAFREAYGDDEGQIQHHRGEVEKGRELLLDAGPYGFLTVRHESGGSLVVTGAAGKPGGLDAVLDTLEAAFPCVCIETYREGLLKLLKRRSYAVDHVRMYKK